MGKWLLWGSVIWVLPLMWFLMRNETKPKKNLVVGVTLPYEGREDPEVLALCARYRRRLNGVCLLLAAASVPMLLVKSFSLSMTWLLVWVLLICVLPQVPYALCNRALKQVKERRGWKRTGGGTVVADLSAAAVPVRWLSPLWFAPALLMSLFPSAAELWRGDGAMAAVWLFNAVTVLVFYAVYRWTYRNRAETVDDNPDLTAALTRLRRYQWGRCWLGLAWLSGLFYLLLWLLLDTTWPLLAVIGGYTVGVVLLAVGTEFRVRRLQETLTADSGRGFYVDEDDRWIWGIFYYNPNDSRLMINARTGMNTTFNLARRSGQVIMGLTAAVMLCLPLIGVWLMLEENRPVELTLTETEVVASHSGTRYEIPLEEIASAQVLEELPAMNRVMGTGMETVLKGRFRAPELGTLTVCLDPRMGPWLHLTLTDGTQYLLGDSQGTAIREVWETISLSTS